MKLIQYSCLEPFSKEESGCLLFVLFLKKTKRRLKYFLITENSRGFYVAGRKNDLRELYRVRNVTVDW